MVRKIILKNIFFKISLYETLSKIMKPANLYLQSYNYFWPNRFVKNLQISVRNIAAFNWLLMENIWSTNWNLKILLKTKTNLDISKFGTCHFDVKWKIIKTMKIWSCNLQYSCSIWNIFDWPLKYLRTMRDKKYS